MNLSRIFKNPKALIVGALAAAGIAVAIAKKGDESPQLTDEERTEAALRAIRFLVAAAEKDREALIQTFQHAARLPKTGVLDDATYQSMLSLADGQPDHQNLVKGLQLIRGNAEQKAEVKAEEKAQAQAQTDPEIERAMKEQLARKEAEERARKEAESKARADAEALAKAQAEAAARAQAAQPSQPAEEVPLLTRVSNDLLAQGSKYNKEQMKALQKTLKLSADGLYGPKTRAAMIAAGAPSTIPPPYYGAKRR